eukprot:5364487-Heterocapsa_arctica.AAC.1
MGAVPHHRLAFSSGPTMGAVPHGCIPSHVAVGRGNVHSTSCRACRRRPAQCFTRLSIDLQVFTSISAASPQ